MSENNKFVNLAPIVHSDKDSIYIQAFAECIGDPAVSNIALTGPYGAGKSSILKRFLQDKPDTVNPLVISLASFEKDEDKNQQGSGDDYSKSERSTDGSDLELRILQQIIYSAGPDELKASRFRRIQIPKDPFFSSMAVVGWLVSATLLFSQWKSIFSASLGGLASIALIVFITIFLVSSLYGIRAVMQLYAGTLLKKVSLKNMEFEASTEQTSVLNKFFDELLYFFSVKQYNLVIFEDIDRFDKPQIFVKLREINALLNNNDAIKKNGRHIQFLYAIKDGIFNERERTKFFEFIIPVVPVVGTYNSDILLHTRANQLAGTHKKIDEQFISNVAQYLNDARLINNSFNELTIYLNAINDRQLDPTVMLAIMLYKNIYGRDFEALHDGQGEFYSLLQSIVDMKNEAKRDKNLELKKLEIRVAEVNEEAISSEKVLLDVYLCELYRNNINSIDGVGHLGSIESAENLVRFFDGDNFRIRSLNGNQSYFDNTKIRTLQNKINSKHTFKARLQLIKEKNVSAQTNLRKEIQKMKSELEAFDHLRLNELLNKLPKYLDGLFVDKKTAVESNKYNQNQRLMRYLLLSGYLNEDYELYTSIFREQDHWTSKDRLYLTTVRSLEKADPTMPIDNAEEVVKRLEGGDWLSEYVLNVDLINYLLSTKSNPNELKQVARAYKEHYGSDTSNSFISSYLNVGKHRKELFLCILEQWPEYLTDTWIEDYPNAELVAVVQLCQLKEVLGEHSLELVANKLSYYTRAFLPDGLSKPKYKQVTESIKLLDVKVNDLTVFEKDTETFKFFAENNLYAINWKNIQSILTQYEHSPDKIISQTYSAILEESRLSIAEYVSENLEQYLGNVMLVRKENCLEEQKAITTLLCNEAMTVELCEDILDHQDFLFTKLDEVSEEYWSAILRKQKLRPSWLPIFQVYESEYITNEELSKYLNNDAVCDQLSEQTFPESLQGESSLDFRRFLLNANTLSDNCYTQLNTAVGTTWSTFPDSVSLSKKILLAKSRLVALNEKSFEQAREDAYLMAELLISKHRQFIQSSLKLTHLDHDVYLEIFRSGANEELKISICESVDTELLELTSDIVEEVAPHYLKLAETEIDVGVLSYLINSSIDKEISFSLFKKALGFSYDIDCLELLIAKVRMWNECSVMEVLELMPQQELKALTKYGKRPKITHSDQNKRLLEEMKKRAFIRSFKLEGEYLRVSTKRSAN